MTRAVVRVRYPRIGSISTREACDHSTPLKPSIDQYTRVTLLTFWMNCGMKLTGNHAPPIADMKRMAKVERARADSWVGETAAISIPKEVHAAAAKTQVRTSIGRCDVTSIP